MSDASLPVDALEEQRVTELRAAQTKAERLFREIEARGLICSGISESHLNAEIYKFAKEMYGITTYWHKRIVRAGRNTLAPYDENPPDLMIREDEILLLDLGPSSMAGSPILGGHLSSAPTRLSSNYAMTLAQRLRKESDTSTICLTTLRASSLPMPSHWRTNSDGNSAAALPGT